jgi:hypothetical protein
MQFRIPRKLAELSYAFEEWGDKDVTIRRIDLLIALFFVLGACWSFYAGGWLVLAEYTLLFIFIIICCVWMG